MSETIQNRNLKHYGWLSFSAAIFTSVLKFYAYDLTDSVGLLSDALESLINLVAAVILLIVLNIASKPPDDRHTYGHEKIEYFSSGAEGGLIILAAIGIAATAVDRLWYPQPLQKLDIGIALSILASVVNLVVARVLIVAGRRHHSIALEADGKHLMTDVWTTLGVVSGLTLILLAEKTAVFDVLPHAIQFTSSQLLDSMIALAVALHIVVSGVDLMRRTFAGLMDAALPACELQMIVSVLEPLQANQGVAYHALRTRYAGPRRFVSFHLLVPGNWSVQQGHDLAEAIEHDIKALFDIVDVDIHLEPIEDLASWLH